MVVNYAGLWFVEVPLVFSSLGTASTIIMLVQIWVASCRHRFSLATWLASAMVFSSCLELLGSEPLFCLFDTFIGLSNANENVSKELSTILTKHQGALTWSQRSHYTLMCTIVVLLREDEISISESWKDSIGDNYRGNWSCPTMVDRYRSRVFLFPPCGATFELCGARLGISNSFIQLQAFYQDFRFTEVAIGEIVLLDW